MSGVVTLKSGAAARWRVANGYVHLDHDEYKKAPMKLLPGKSPEENARWLLHELVRDIKLGTALKRS
jgi:hypothetical protein